MKAPPAELTSLFGRRAWRVRFQQSTRRVLGGAAFGAAAGALGAAVLWALGAGELRAFAAVGTLLGAALGLLYAARRRWSDAEVALFLDARLNGKESITTAVLAAPAAPGSAAAFAREGATRLLRDADGRRLKTRVLSPWHAGLPIALGLIAWLSSLPLPVAAGTRSSLGRDLVGTRDVPGLDKIEALAGAPGISAADAQALKRLAEQAKRLRAELDRGLERREAQARVAELADGIAAARRSFGDRHERAARDAAMAALGANPGTRAAARALGEGDIVAFDEAMQRLANQAESAALEEAKRALEEAARRARARGSAELGALLDRQRRLLQERADETRALRELMGEFDRELDESTRRDLDALDEDGDLEARQRIAEALSEALESLTDEERRRLAERLKERLADPDADLSPMTREKLEDLARQLASEDAREALRERLKALAEPTDPEAERERALSEAERGGSEAERSLRGLVPLPGGQGDGAPSSRGGPGQRGGSSREPAAHAAPGSSVDAEELRSKARARALPGAPLGIPALGRAPARAGETADQVGTGQLGSVAAGEVEAAERAEIPREYREQVGRYFQP